jgi:hypothetical protein
LHVLYLITVLFIYLLTLQPFYTCTNRNETHSFGCQIRFLTEGVHFCLFSRCFTGYLSESHPYIEENLQYNKFRDNFRLEMRWILGWFSWIDYLQHNRTFYSSVRKLLINNKHLFLANKLLYSLGNMTSIVGNNANNSACNFSGYTVDAILYHTLIQVYNCIYILHGN